MKHRLQRVDLRQFLGSEIPIHELSPDLRQHLRHALSGDGDLRPLAARAVRQLLSRGLFSPSGQLRQGNERVPLHRLAGSTRAYDLRELMGDIDSFDAEDVLADDPTTFPEQEAGQPSTSNGQASDAWASIGAVRALLRQDWVSYGLETALAGLLGELRTRLGDASLRLVIWEERFGVPVQPGEAWESLSEEGPVGRALLDAVQGPSQGGAEFRDRMWFAVWSQQRIVAAVGSAPTTSPALVSEAAAAVGDLLQAYVRSQQRVFADPLTGVNNRGFFDHQFGVELERARRGNIPIALLFADLDFFKKINDNYGHAAGDQVLQSVARLFVSHLRRVDYVFRWGGEEFAILLPGTDRDEALHTAERLRSVVKETTVRTTDGVDIQPTVSIGLALFPYNGNSERELLRSADEALYQAKEDGRDCVRLWSASSPPQSGN